MTRLDGPGDDRNEGPGDAPDAVALDIADAVESLTNLWSTAAQRAALRLSTHQLRALLVLEAATDLNLTALAERLGIGLPTASRLCDRLEAAGMLERSLHPERRREVRLSLTAQGRRVLDDVAARRARALAAVLAGMEPAERSALRRAMKAFLAARSGEPRPPEAP
ncbi:MarR family winged helix-turn-helix transcriptional regulator [Streptomyces marokkonensis]|uniref:MarR family winged helix-turn-helix transcriptional regulator n=1 Tax=Streptomyces marokkonensis TaxID=324855 RepID=UPI0011F3F787|nr:MarR family winged helix-turn-helix transcriptional regulator [Streptomyces marokkonensis]